MWHKIANIFTNYFPQTNPLSITLVNKSSCKVSEAVGEDRKYTNKCTCTLALGKLLSSIKYPFHSPLLVEGTGGGAPVLVVACPFESGD